MSSRIFTTKKKTSSVSCAEIQIFIISFTAVLAFLLGEDISSIPVPNIVHISVTVGLVQHFQGPELEMDENMKEVEVGALS